MPASSNPLRRSRQASHCPHGRPSGVGIVATVGQPEIEHPSSCPSLTISALRQSQQRRVDLQARAALDAGFGRQVRHALVGLDELGTAVGIARVVERVHADEDVGRFQHLGPRQRERKEDGVARRDVGDGNAVRPSRRRSRPSGTAMSSVSADPPNASRPIFATMCRSTPSACGHARRGLQLDLVPLPVVERERVAGVPLAARERQAGGGVEASGEQADGLLRWSDDIPELALSPGALCMESYPVVQIPLSHLDSARHPPRQRHVCRHPRAGAARSRTSGTRSTIESPTRAPAGLHGAAPALQPRSFAPSPAYDLTVGFDMDGYRIARRRRARGVAERRDRRRGPLRARLDAAHDVRCRRAASDCMCIAPRVCSDQPLLGRARAGVLRTRAARPRSCRS